MKTITQKITISKNTPNIRLKLDENEDSEKNVVNG